MDKQNNKATKFNGLIFNAYPVSTDFQFAVLYCACEITAVAILVRRLEKIT